MRESRTPISKVLNSLNMKIIKWFSILLIGLLIALIFSLEAYYFYSANKLDLKTVASDSVYSHEVYDSIWASLGEKGEIDLEATSATGFTLSFFSYAFYGPNSDYSDHFSKGAMVSNQVARLLNLKNRQRTVDRHLSSIVTAIWLSKNSKVDDLLGFLINESYYGKRQYGIASASRYYFDKTLESLNLSEVVSLISLLKAPSRYNPYCNPERFRRRAEFVYSQLQQNWPDKYAGQLFSLPQVAEGKDRECK